MTPLEEALLLRVRELEKLVASLETPILTFQERIDKYDLENPGVGLRKAESELGISRETIRKRRNERAKQ